MRSGEADKPVIAMFAHLLLLIGALAAVWSPGLSAPSRWTAVLVACNAVPAAAVAYRRSRGGVVQVPLVPSILLYHIYFLARLAALSSLLLRRGAVRA